MLSHPGARPQEDLAPMSITEDTARPLDRRGRRLSPAAMPGFHKGRTPVTKGRTLPDARRQLREGAKRAGLRRRANPHCFRHAHAVELWREKIDVYTIQQQLGHARLDVTANYLRGVGAMEILEPIAHRPT